MVRKPDIQYIRCYTDGSSARALRPLFAAPKTKLPKQRRKKALVIRLDPLAYAAVALSVVMLVLMIVSCFQLTATQRQIDQMDSYVDSLKEENARLSDGYHSGYDLKDIEQKALAMGLVPIEQVQRVTVSVSAPVQSEDAPEGDFWAFLTDLSE